LHFLVVVVLNHPLLPFLSFCCWLVGQISFLIFILND